MSAMDVDGDGIPEIGLAYEFGANPTNSAGKLAILKSTGDPTALWTLKEIDAIPTSHRVRFADIGGQKWLINAPIKRQSAKLPPARPREGDACRLVSTRHFPTRCGKSFSFSLHTNSRSSVSGISSGCNSAVHGFVYAFGSSMVICTSMCPKSRR